MYLLTINEKQDNGAYAVLNRYGEKVLFMFEEEDDAERYAMMLNVDEEDSSLSVIEVDLLIISIVCERFSSFIQGSNKMSNPSMLISVGSE